MAQVGSRKKGRKEGGTGISSARHALARQRSRVDPTWAPATRTRRSMMMIVMQRKEVRLGSRKDESLNLANLPFLPSARLPCLFVLASSTALQLPRLVTPSAATRSTFRISLRTKLR